MFSLPCQKMNQLAYCLPVTIVSQEVFIVPGRSNSLYTSGSQPSVLKGKEEKEKKSSYFAILFARSVVEEKYDTETRK